MRPVTAMVVGAGQRGHHVYGAWALAHPESLVVSAVVDPDPVRRRRLGSTHGIPEARRFRTTEDAITAGVGCDAWIVSGPDRSHFAAAMTALERGIHVLVEKPIGATAAEAAAVAAAASESDVVAAAALVLREAPFFRAVHDVVASGTLGDLVAVEHGEHVAAWHMAHSFVRGAWSRTAAATPFIVQKCCHDLDLISWNLGEDRVTNLTSHGSAAWFRPRNAPVGAAGRCTDGCVVDDCPYDARTIYLDERRQGWPVHVITDDLSSGGRRQALQNGPYGVCAYLAGSDVVERQVVAMRTATGVTITFAADGHAALEHRTIAYRGTAATLTGRFGARSELVITDRRTGTARPLPITPAVGGHGGGDDGVIRAFVDAIRGDGPRPAGPSDVLEGHLLAFAAERSRIGDTSVEMGSFRDAAGRRTNPLGGGV